MINLINGIIVDTFQELREKNYIRTMITQNNCYICNLDRTTLEVEGENFETHTNKFHNIANYIKYILKVIKTEESELNSAESNIKYSIDKDNISIFPNKKYYKIGNEAILEYNHVKIKQEKVEDDSQHLNYETIATTINEKENDTTAI